MIKKFLKNFDKKRLKVVSELIIILAFFVCIVNIVGKTYTRYESNVDISADASVAFFIVNQGTYENTISLTGLTPSTEPLYYTFYVTNYKDDKRANVDLEYKISFETTTNLPLQYEIIRNESFSGNHTNLLGTPTVRQDEHDVYYRVYENDETYSFVHTANEADQYVLKVVFPESYKNSPDLYQGGVELFSIIIDASQVA